MDLDINTLATFLASDQVSDLSQTPQVDCIVVCASAVLHGAETVFSAIQANPKLTKTLVLCGGIGHSTQYLYDAVRKRPRYRNISNEIGGLPEARVLYRMFEMYYDVAAIADAGCTILVEDKSTNCGANAVETRKLLEAQGVATPRSVILVQDPTMALRTVASFQKTYADVSDPPTIRSCPTFVPNVGLVDGKLTDIRSAESRVDIAGLWDIDRFTDLILGEIPRLRDDDNGYGPKGKGFIVHVDIPHDVEMAWRRLYKSISSTRAPK